MFVLQEKPIDINEVRNSLKNPKNGALVTFEGMVRSDQKDDMEVASLLYMANFAECLDEGEKIVKEAIDLLPLNNAVCIQRIGDVKVGECAIWIGVWASHREEAFKGCRYIIEEVKKRLLIWKKEIYTNGRSQWIYGKETPKII